VNSFDIITLRLRLVTITTELMDADAARSKQLGVLLSAEVPSFWPPEHWEPHVYAFMKEQALHHPHTVGWNRFVVLNGQRPTLIGTICAFPKGESEAEIGYSVLGPWQRCGFATEGVRAFITELFRGSSLRTLTAQTFPELIPSIGILSKCGFQFVGSGEEDGAVRYRLERSVHSGGDGYLTWPL
jgi:[ribosomal protein S5]-alanine N-acetyltransferase